MPLSTRVGSARPTLKAGRRSLSVSPVAYLAAGLGVVGLVVGRSLGWVEFVAAGTLLLVLVVIAGLSTIGRSSYQVDLRLGEHNVKVGERAFGSIDVHNVGRRSVLPARIELNVGRGRAEFALPMLAPDATHNELFAVPTTRRSVIGVGPVKSVRADALGLVRREVTWTDREELFVHPRTVSLAGAAAGVIHDLEGQSRNTLSEDDMSFHALREYVPGDDKRTIHWKSSARANKLMVRQFEDTRRTHTAVSLDVFGPHWDAEQSFELGVSVLASFGLQVLRDSMDASLFAGARTLRTHSAKALLDDSSRIELPNDQGERPEPRNRRPQATDPASRIAMDAPTCSLAVVITGTTQSRAELSEVAKTLPVGARALFLLCEDGAESVVASRGQVSFATLGALEDLGRVLRMAVVA